MFLLPAGQVLHWKYTKRNSGSAKERAAYPSKGHHFAKEKHHYRSHSRLHCSSESALNASDAGQQVFNPLSTSATGAESLRERLCAALDAKSRIVVLMNHADVCLDTLTLSERTKQNRVQGCASITYVKTQFGERSDGLAIVRCVQGFSDSRLSKGLLALLAIVLHGRTLPQVQSIDMKSVLDSFCLGSVASSPRFGGATAILRHVERQMQLHLEDAEHLRGVADSPQISRGSKVVPDPTSTRNSDARAEIAVLLSGGVDSAVAMARLLEQGLRIQPFYLKIWLEDELSNLSSCPWKDDIRHAEEVCSTLSRKYNVNLQLEVLPLQEEYWNRIVLYTVEEARAGRTPNPDIMCNSRIKFGAFLDAVGLNYPQVASGHYARTRKEMITDRDGEPRQVVQLLRSRDSVKDQTYFLSQLTQQQLMRAVFPIGDFTKSQVRLLAREHYMLPNNDRPDSQGICFLGKLKFDQFLEYHLGTRSGSIIEAESGRILGTHRGYWFFTVGQRRGLSLPGGPWYVVGKDTESNLVFVSRDRSCSQSDASVFLVENVNWIGIDPTNLSSDSIVCEIKIRHGTRTVEGALRRAGLDGDSWLVHLHEAEPGIAPGQFAVFYLGQQCLGGGVIALTSKAVAMQSMHQLLTGRGSS
jgi:tRNA-specific 2-thiouridylase